MRKTNLLACGVVLHSLSFAATAGGSTTISATEFGTQWPFSVASGELECVEPGAVTFAANGKVYAVNGLAMSNSRNAEIREIWKDDTESQHAQYMIKQGRSDLVPKISLGPIIDRGTKLCR